MPQKKNYPDNHRNTGYRLLTDVPRLSMACIIHIYSSQYRKMCLFKVCATTFTIKLR